MTTKRYFILGDKWIYYKLYMSELYADAVLSNTVWKIVTNMYNEKIISKFFYIRYSDPDFHLRIRFELISLDDLPVLVKSLKNEFYPLLLSGLISSIKLDTYQREIERYKPIYIDSVESFFSQNSLMAIKLIKIVDVSDDLRWLTIMKWVDNFFSLLNMSLSDRYLFVLDLRNSFSSEFVMDKVFYHSVNEKYKFYKKEINSFMIGDSLSKYGLVSSILIDDLIICKKIFSKKMNRKKMLEDENKFSSIFGLLHMCFNRVFVKNNRFHEVLLYDLLRRYYDYKLHMYNSVE